MCYYTFMTTLLFSQGVFCLVLQIYFALLVFSLSQGYNFHTWTNSLNPRREAEHFLLFYMRSNTTILCTLIVLGGTPPGPSFFLVVHLPSCSRPTGRSAPRHIPGAFLQRCCRECSWLTPPASGFDSLWVNVFQFSPTSQRCAGGLVNWLM